MALLRLTDIENSRRSAAFGVVALHDLVREVGDIYEPIAEDKQITLSIAIETNADVCGDRDLLFEAIINLVDNAVKFTPEGGRVEIELVQAEKGALVRVTDTGPGISRQETEIVLRRFYRSDKTRHAPGVGLGLNLVAAIVKLHGFRLLIHPGPGGRIEIVCAKHDAPRSSTRLALSA
jgi:signal transduction histidine kinase